MEKTKCMKDMRVTESKTLGAMYSLIKLVPADGTSLPLIYPGQFVQVEISDSKTTYLRRPISVNYVDYETNELWLLVRKAGDGTRHLCARNTGDIINVIMPLGNGFTMPEGRERHKLLLVGGGVGVAPLLYLGSELRHRGYSPEFLLGARTTSDLLLLNDFETIGTVHISTEDGSKGEKGLVTTNSVFGCDFDMIYCCGPLPMMKAVAAIAKSKNTICEVSLENKMACGLGACLCCVEKKSDGHNVCVCTDGPVFNSIELPW